MTIHPDFKTKKILTFIADLIISYDYNSYDDLAESDKSTLAALMNEAGGRDDELSFLVEGDTRVFLALFRKSLTGLPEDKENLMEALKDQAVQYYDYTMHQLFDYVINDYESSRKEWLDHMAKHGDPDQATDFYLEGLA